MKLYDCAVRLAGNINHVVPKHGVTEYEIIALRHIHGNDAVVSIRSNGEADRNKKDDLIRLAGTYGKETIERLFKIPLDLDTIVEDTIDTPSEEVGLAPEQSAPAGADQTKAAAKKAA